MGAHVLSGPAAAVAWGERRIGGECSAVRQRALCGAVRIATLGSAHRARGLSAVLVPAVNLPHVTR